MSLVFRCPFLVHTLDNVDYSCSVYFSSFFPLDSKASLLIPWVKLRVLRRFGHAHPYFQVYEPEISSSLCPSILEMHCSVWFSLLMMLSTVFFLNFIH